MLETEQTLDRERRRRSREAREVGYERKVGKELPVEAQKAAAMERAEQYTKEIKSSKKQMQNILLHMTQVTQAIKRLREQLQLADDSDDPGSIKQDKKQVEELKKKISFYQEEIIKMRDDLIREQMEELHTGLGRGMSADLLEAKATEMVERMIEKIKQ